jgi:hypothetical protein
VRLGVVVATIADAEAVAALRDARPGGQIETERQSSGDGAADLQARQLTL